MKANDKSQEAGEHKFILVCAKVLSYHYAEKENLLFALI